MHLDLISYLVVASTALTPLARELWVRRAGWQIRRALGYIKSTSIADAADGRAVKITGEASAASELITSPLTKTPCLYYLFITEKHDGGRWKEERREQRAIEILLRDRSGVASVSLEGAQVDGHVATWPGWAWSGALNRRGAPRHLRSVEFTLRPGKLTVGGVLRWELDTHGAGESYREAPRRAVLRSTDEIALLVSQR